MKSDIIRFFFGWYLTDIQYQTETVIDISTKFIPCCCIIAFPVVSKNWKGIWSRKSESSPFSHHPVLYYVLLCSVCVLLGSSTVKPRLAWTRMISWRDWAALLRVSLWFLAVALGASLPRLLTPVCVSRRLRSSLAVDRLTGFDQPAALTFECDWTHAEAYVCFECFQ